MATTRSAVSPQAPVSGPGGNLAELRRGPEPNAGPGMGQDPGAGPAPGSAPGALAEQEGSQLIVGRDIQVKGEILSCGTLIVEGRVEASMDSRVIRIAEGGVFIGEVGIDTAEIMGRFDGKLTARKRLIIHPTGRVSGTIRYGAIQIQEGGQIMGDVQVISGSGSPSAEEPQGRTDRGEGRGR